ncbi:response regulator [Paenibacillus sp. YPG26]|uniref:response regulator n=1 Tax=Paenibacillus sp. YPG26 TaxID=2878915 RepID=UPI00203CBA35|nr:response regulator [Paenibacillus sp. YPG26]USB34836.1 response regulator [Paenibacillus sp. YPG26]
MYKLILVDDESDVREGLLTEIDWHALGFTVADTAENGREAAEMIEKHQPDIVVTDIQMPFMNGLQLSEWIRENYPATRIIILTGYDEFEYAQKAIRLQIDEYVLKPFSSQEIIQILLKVKGNMDEEVAQKENIHLLTEHYRRNLPVLQSIFLSSLVTRRLPRNEIHDKLQSYSLSLEGGKYMVSVIRLDPKAHDERTEVTNPESEGPHTINEAFDHDLELFAVLNITSEIAGKYEKGHAFIHHDEVVVLSISNKSDPESLSQSTLSMLEEIRHSMERYLKRTITLGAGSVQDSLERLYMSYKDAVQALDYRLLYGGNKVIWIEDMENRTLEPFTFSDFNEQELVRCLKVGTEQEISMLMDQLFDRITDSKISYQEFQIYLLEMLTAAVKVAKEIQVDLDRLLENRVTGLGEITKFSHAGEAKAWFRALCLKLRNSIASDRESSYNRLVMDAKEYIRQHYRESEISINKVCEHLHISTGYFSAIFKKEVKMTFVNYLLGIRMEAAQELLRNTELKAFEIAEQVGFADPNYFSFCFRKKFGISPKEYRGGAKVQ